MMNIYILLQGLFFLEFKPNPDRLFITAPVITDPTGGVFDHKYRFGNPGNLNPIPLNTLFDWSGQLSSKSPTKAFPDAMLKFSKTQAGTGDITDDLTKFAFRLILPPPTDPIFLLRIERNPKAFQPLPGHVWDSIKKHSSPSSIPLMACLQYQGNSDPSGSNTERCHFYAECQCPEDIGHVNSAYKQCKTVFSTGFDFQMDPNVPSPFPVNALPPVQDDPRLIDLGTRGLDDEQSLSELLKGKVNCPPPPDDGVNVANCAYFGVIS